MYIFGFLYLLDQSLREKGSTEKMYGSIIKTRRTLLPGINSGIHIGNSNGLGASSININSGEGRIYLGSGSVASTSEVNIGNAIGGTSFIGPIQTSVTTGYTYSGSIPVSGSTCNSKVGTASFTATITSGSTNTFTIANNCAGTVGIVSMTCATTTTDAIVQMQSITWTANTNIVIIVRNVGASPTGSVTFTFSFMSFN